MKSKIIRIIAVLMLLCAGICIFWKFFSDNDDKIILKETPAVIESSRPIGVLYLYNVKTEDYVTGSFYGSGIGNTVLGKGNGILKKKHHCVQILRQQVSLIMNLEDVVYEPVANSDTVFVKLPDVDFKQSTVNSWFRSDDEDEEGKVGYDASDMIRRAERKIESKYNTPQNRKKARLQAEKIISCFLDEAGKIAVFK